MTRGLWDRETVALFLLAAYLPLAVFWLWSEGPEAAVRLGVVVLVLLICHLIFLLARAQPPTLAGLVAALAVAMLAPEGLSVFQLALGTGFGAIMGELVFGGWGRNVVNPATVALAFLGFGFPGLAWPGFAEPVAWAAIASALLGLAAGVMPAAVIGGAAAAGIAGWAAGWLPAHMIAGAGIVLVLLVIDPVTSASTELGRWLNGALYGGLVTLFAAGWDGAAPVQIAVAAALLASLSAPALDEVGLAFWLARRRRRHGRN